MWTLLINGHFVWHDTCFIKLKQPKEDLSMKSLTLKKAILCILTVSSIVIAGALTKSSPSIVKMTNIEIVEKNYLPVERSVASENINKVAIMWLPVNEDNSSKINTVWEITRIVGSDELVIFDKLVNSKDAKKSLKIKIELIKNGVVKINNDDGQIYNVSLMSDFGTIALYKKMNNGFEIVEARKVLSSNSSLVVSEEVELILERALNQTKSNKVLEGGDVTGQVTLSAKKLTGLSVELKNTNSEIQNIEISSAELLDGGTFKAEVNGEDVSGIVLNNGKDGYRISFVTGPIAGSMLNFVTKEQLVKLEENQEVAEEVIFSEDQQEAESKIIEERKEVASDVDSYEPVKVLSAEEVQETASQNGFSF